MLLDEKFKKIIIHKMSSHLCHEWLPPYFEIVNPGPTYSSQVKHQDGIILSDNLVYFNEITNSRGYASSLLNLSSRDKHIVAGINLVNLNQKNISP